MAPDKNLVSLPSPSQLTAAQFTAIAIVPPENE
jgi:hypothetical protein